MTEPAKTPAPANGNGNGRWHISRTINIGHVVALVAIIISFSTWASMLERRIDLNEQAIQFVQSSLDKIEAKLDRLIEKDRSR